jgi:HSP20 family protein
MSVLVEPFPPWLRDVNRFFSNETQVPAFVPPADVLVRDEGVTVYMDIPGVASDAVEIELENDILAVRGERPFPYATEDGATVRRIERGFGAFERSLRVPRGLNPEAIEASMTDGVLTLQIPQPEELKPHRIQVQDATQPRTIEGTATDSSPSAGSGESESSPSA